MDLVFKNKTEDITAVEDRLKDLSLAYVMVEDGTIDSPALVDGKKSYEGLEAMNEYIDLLDREKGQWYYCDC